MLFHMHIQRQNPPRNGVVMKRLELRFCVEMVLVIASARKTSAFLAECEISSYQLIYKDKTHPEMGW